jgi:hypothetical protein
MHRINWQLWSGFLLSVFAFISYPTLFVQWPLTRDFPWANILIFIVAVVLTGLGLKRAFGSGRGIISRVGAVLLAGIAAACLGLFIMIAFVSATWLPKAEGVPQIGKKAPDFTLTDSTGKRVSLAELQKAPVGTNPARGVLLIFYRGYW